MLSALTLFDKIISDNESTMVTYDFLFNEVKPPFDYSDLLRWQWAQSVSALDKLVHELVKIGMKQEFLNLRQRTDKFLSFVIPMKIYQNIESESDITRKVIIYQQFVT